MEEKKDVVADPDTWTVQWDGEVRRHDNTDYYRQTIGWLLALGRRVVCGKCGAGIPVFYEPYCKRCGPHPPPLPKVL